MIVYKDGSWMPVEQTAVSVMDHGFLYGVGLFETYRTYNGVPFLFHDHLKRLRDGLSSVYIEWTEDEKNLEKLMGISLERNKLADGVFRLNVTAGVSNWGLPTETYMKPSTLIFARPVPEQVMEKEAVILKRRRNTPEGDVRLKSHHYLNSLLGKRELGDSNAEGIFLTADDHIAEGIVSNIFWVRNEILYTPAISTGILNGVTRQFILHLAKLAGVKVEEGYFLKEDLEHCEEAFLTNSTQEVVRISRIGDKHFPNKTHSLMNNLMKLYKESTKLQLLSYHQVKKVEIRNDQYTIISE